VGEGAGVRLWHLVRHRYPYTASSALFTIAAIALYAYPVTHVAGKYAFVIVACIAVQLAARFIGAAGYRWSKRRDSGRRA